MMVKLVTSWTFTFRSLWGATRASHISVRGVYQCAEGEEGEVVWMLCTQDLQNLRSRKVGPERCLGRGRFDLRV
jgi:hypothetical protein